MTCQAEGKHVAQYAVDIRLSDQDFVRLPAARESTLIFFDHAGPMLSASMPMPVGACTPAAGHL
jgi:hypothetical protein